MRVKFFKKKFPSSVASKGDVSIPRSVCSVLSCPRRNEWLGYMYLDGHIFSDRLPYGCTTFPFKSNGETEIYIYIYI